MKLFLAFVAVWMIFDSGVSAEATECQMWDDVVMTAMDQEFLNVTCRRSDLCNGFSCSGSFLYQHDVFMGSEPFGFAVEFIPCSYPLVLRIRVNTTDSIFTKVISVSGRNEESILLVKPGVVGLEEPYGRLTLEWNAVLRPVKFFVAMTINFTRIYVEGEFPPITLVPLHNFPIPNCQYLPPGDSDQMPPPAEGGCVFDDCGEVPDKVMTGKHAVEDTVVKYAFVFKVCVGVGMLLVALCVILGFVLVRHHRRSSLARKTVACDSNDEEDEGDDDLLAMAMKSPNLPEDKRNLLQV